MKKVFVLIMDAYDDFGAHLGSKIVGVYTTIELAQKQIDISKKSAVLGFKEYIAQNVNGELDMSEEDQSRMYSNYIHSTMPMDYQYTIEESTLEGE